MVVKVRKFGGTSVGSAKSIEKIILKNDITNDRYVIVLSTFNGITDALSKIWELATKKDDKYLFYIVKIEIRYLKTIIKLFDITNQSKLISKTKKSINDLEIYCDSILNIDEIYKRNLDKIMSYGELISSLLIYEKLKLDGINVVWKDSRDLILTDEEYGCAKVFLSASYKRIKDYFDKEKSYYVILPGFIAYSTKYKTTTLGRGGSDYTASIISAAINANLIEIWTDVSGIMTSDPYIVYPTYPINIITYKEALELSYFGAKVLYFPTIFPTMVKNIPIFIKNTFLPLYPGSTINQHSTIIPNSTGISCITNLVLMTIEGNIDIVIDVISRYKTNMMFLAKINLEYSIKLVINNNIYKPIINHKQYCNLIIEKDINIISLISNNIKKNNGIICKLFSILKNNKINIRAIAQGNTEKNIAVIIYKNNLLKAMNILHETFFQCYTKKINILISGLGQVGQQFINILHAQKKYFYTKLKLKFIVIGICNSRMMYLNRDGIYDLLKCKNYLQHGEMMNYNILLKNLIKINLRNIIFVDNTASNEITSYYNLFLEKGIGIITCNKNSCSSNYKTYKKLQNLSICLKIPFLFETNVGAGLPIIRTMKDLINSGDKIDLIEAVLSGSLNFILKNLHNCSTFCHAIRYAQRKAYTEPDPRLDLSGIDVMRKIIILVRECGDNLELKDIKTKFFLPECCLKASSLEEFYNNIINCENDFIYLKSKSGYFRFIAYYKFNNKVSVGLKKQCIDNPFTQLEGTENMIVLTTRMYKKEPMIIKGKGAGAEVTAYGVIADLIKASI